MRYGIFFPALSETGSCYVAQAGLELMGSSDPPTSASCVLGLQICTTVPRSPALLKAVKTLGMVYILNN
jgi:hypothetical protein